LAEELAAKAARQQTEVGVTPEECEEAGAEANPEYGSPLAISIREVETRRKQARS